MYKYVTAIQAVDIFNVAVNGSMWCNLTIVEQKLARYLIQMGVLKEDGNRIHRVSFPDDCIITTDGERFHAQQSRDLARSVYARFGRDPLAAVAAWNRMMQTDLSVDQFVEILH